MLSLLRGLAADMNLTIAFISHDLSVIRTVCSQIMVLNRGEIVEAGQCEQVFNAPQSEIPRTLINAIPLPEIDDGWFDSIKLNQV